MKQKYYIGWVRSGEGRGLVKKRPIKAVANAITSYVGGGIPDRVDGLGNTTPHVVYEYK